jgi:putative transposase
MSERRACQVAKQPRGTQRYHATQRDDEDALTRAIITLASQYGRFGYRRIMACPIFCTSEIVSVAQRES